MAKRRRCQDNRPAWEDACNQGLVCPSCSALNFVESGGNQVECQICCQTFCAVCGSIPQSPHHWRHNLVDCLTCGEFRGVGLVPTPCPICTVVACSGCYREEYKEEHNHQPATTLELFRCPMEVTSAQAETRIDLQRGVELYSSLQQEVFPECPVEIHAKIGSFVIPDTPQLVFAKRCAQVVALELNRLVPEKKDIRTLLATVLDFLK